MNVPPMICLLPVTTLPHVAPGDDLAELIHAALDRESIGLADGDIIVIAQKIVSKAEGRMRRLSDIRPSEEAIRLSETTCRDPRLVELVLQESSAILRATESLLVVEHRLGHVMANAGIDRSNVEGDHPGDDEIALLLPEDPDASARQLREGLARKCGIRPGVIISDSFGRPWRMGTVGVAIGVAGPGSLIDRRGEPDLYGRALQVTEVAQADAIAAAAVLAMGEGAEGKPAVVVRGLEWHETGQSARDVLRPRERDMFR